MIFTPADRNLAEDLFTRVAQQTRERDGCGVYRPSYGLGESTAWRLVVDTAREHGLHAGSDVAGNVVMAPRGLNEGPRTGEIWIGSHLDAVPHGGNYDGLAGVVAALLLLIKARETQCPLPLVGLGLRGEESAWFGTPYLGSRAILGKLRPHDLDRRRRSTDAEEGSLLRYHMEKLGIQATLLVETPGVTSAQVAAFWELHIEQGPLLATRDKPVGVVTGIRGNVRAPRARVTGRADHSGTTPHELRHDAVMRLAQILTGLEARRQELAARGHDLVFTCGIVGTDPAKHSITTIADEVHLALEVRSLCDQHARDFLAHAASLGLELGSDVVTTPAAQIAPETWERAARACAHLGIPHEVMPSGAGHDAAMFQAAGIPSGMIFVRNTHGSHNPDEAMDLDDFLLGCEVLWQTITGPA